MSTKLIAQREISASQFSSVTSQAGPYCGQPAAGQNAGSLRPVAQYDIEDLTYSKQTSGAGNVGGTTLIDTDLGIFGDAFWVGASVTVGGETRTVSDFTQLTGTITVSPAFSAQVGAATDYTLTLPYATRDFRMQLTASGDPGAATFKWSHNGGVTWLGRNPPNQANWLAEAVHSNSADNDSCAWVIHCADGKLAMFWHDDAAGVIKRQKSQDHWGLTWDTATTAIAVDYAISAFVHLRYGAWPGRVIIYAGSVAYYSDDDGVTWANLGITVFGFGYFLELFNGTVLGFLEGSNVTLKMSNDGCVTWGSPVTVADTTNTQTQPAAAQLPSGRILCVYSSDEDVLGEYEIKCKLSDDYGSTWGSVTAVINYDTADLVLPAIISDIDGSVYCIAEKSGVGVSLARSTTGGTTWASSLALSNTVGSRPTCFLIQGVVLAAAFTDASDDLRIARRGMLEASASYCPVAPLAIEQHLACCSILWYGAAGIVGDTWSWEAAYQLGLANLLEDSPSVCWRSTGDNVSCNITLDMGETGSLLADGIALFNCNIRSLTLRLDDEESPETWAVEETVSFDVATGTIDVVTWNAMQDTSLLAAYKDHQLKGMYFRATSGADSGLTWRIADNVGSYVMLDISAMTNLAASDTFVIYAPAAAHLFANAVAYRYCEIIISAQQTAEDYYQIGTMLLGKSVSLTRCWDVGYGRSTRYGIEYLGGERGVLDEVKQHDRRRVFSLRWTKATDPREEMEYLLDYVEGRAIALIPDSTVPLDVYLAKRTGNLNLTHWFLGGFDFDVVLEEIL